MYHKMSNVFNANLLFVQVNSGSYWLMVGTGFGMFTVAK